MPTKKDGTAGTPVNPVEPDLALDADDAQAGGLESAPREAPEHTPQTLTLGSVSVGSEQVEPSDDEEDDPESTS